MSHRFKYLNYIVLNIIYINIIIVVSSDFWNNDQSISIDVKIKCINVLLKLHQIATANP